MSVWVDVVLLRWRAAVDEQICDHADCMCLWCRCVYVVTEWCKYDVPQGVCEISNIAVVNTFYLNECHQWWCLVLLPCCCHTDISSIGPIVTVVMRYIYGDSMCCLRLSLLKMMIKWLCDHSVDELRWNDILHDLHVFN